MHHLRIQIHFHSTESQAVVCHPPIATEAPSMVHSSYLQVHSQQLVCFCAYARVRSQSNARSLVDTHRLHLRVGAVLFLGAYWT
jgi:hypothetical protein